LLRLVPDAIPSAEVRAALDRQLRSDALAVEAAFIAHPDNRNRERPYGWGWALALVRELSALDEPQARGWAAAAGPLAAAVTANFVGWLPKATYPVRHGVHGNSAFGIGLALPHASARAAEGDPTLRDAIVGAARRWFDTDVDYPGGWEPSGNDFLSPALVEAELMSRLLGEGRFSGWLAAFLPGIADHEPAALFTPTTVSDSTDGHIAHLHGLNLSRAWCWRRIAAALPGGDPRRRAAGEAALAHAAFGLPVVTGEDYMVEHWLAAYAVLLLT
jgi:hypothetical protein